MGTRLTCIEELLNYRVQETSALVKVVHVASRAAEEYDELYEYLEECDMDTSLKGSQEYVVAVRKIEMLHTILGFKGSSRWHS